MMRPFLCACSLCREFGIVSYSELEGSSAKGVTILSSISSHLYFSSIFHDENIVLHFSQAVNILLLFMRFGTSLVNPLLYTLFKEDSIEHQSLKGNDI
ncbi:hypothetical protein pdam_00022116 [Pocillopora damicornis]|uniref:Uncharacterized protein n=1 Tax=Pocillopora damicornis TaxID=46731 RepID=A0A3M6T6P2_POCDA|nr:hypothetical protein pdam_00022116 [Pocillopora damicornis]